MFTREKELILPSRINLKNLKQSCIAKVVFFIKNMKCTECNGSGWVYHTKGGQGGHTCACYVCKGTGKIKKEKEITMNKYIILTTSESGDTYQYFIQSERKLKNKDFQEWLIVNAYDKDDDECYERITNIIDLNKCTFNTII